MEISIIYNFKLSLHPDARQNVAIPFNCEGKKWDAELTSLPASFKNKFYVMDHLCIVVGRPLLKHWTLLS